MAEQVSVSICRAEQAKRNPCRHAVARHRRPSRASLQSTYKTELDVRVPVRHPYHTKPRFPAVGCRSPARLRRRGKKEKKPRSSVSPPTRVDIRGAHRDQVPQVQKKTMDPTLPPPPLPSGSRLIPPAGRRHLLLAVADRYLDRVGTYSVLRQVTVNMEPPPRVDWLGPEIRKNSLEPLSTTTMEKRYIEEGERSTLEHLARQRNIRP
jgi:hypothetical protein